jgi:hypothetical protein
VVSKADINLVAGALGAEALYGSLCPILLVDDEQFAVLASGQIVEANPAEDET